MAPRVAKLPASVVFNGTAGDSRKLDATFRASLLGEGPLAVDPAHWILAVLPSLTPVAITMRLLIFVFLPAFVFADDLDQEVGAVLFYPAPLSLSRLLHRLVKEGISAEPVPDARALRERVLEHAARLPLAFRLLAREHVVVVKVPSSCVLASMFPLMFRGPDAHNGVLATFLATLPGYFTGVARGLMPAALAAIVPPSSAPSDPPSLLALTCASHIRAWQKHDSRLQREPHMRHHQSLR
ncbi:hypothetical protein AB1Y20_012461 [Prymnesium parvum]|uniref:Uncharacterized protein n=1 Tax=Prymnesium parvum TaxID=97485 RepID=A0AB34IKQ9_PRYPA